MVGVAESVIPSSVARFWGEFRVRGTPPLLSLSGSKFFVMCCLEGLSAFKIFKTKDLRLYSRKQKT
jgi:hypothetical protein